MAVEKRLPDSYTEMFARTRKHIR